MVEQRVSLITLGVSDLRRSRTFYERLGWRGQEVQETVFFQAGGIAVVLWDRHRLAVDCGLREDRSHSFEGMALAHNVRSAQEVDEVVAAAARAGATVTRPPADTFYGGYAGVFTDPDGHAWEVAYNPALPLGEDGSVTIPDLTSAQPAQEEPPEPPGKPPE